MCVKERSKEAAASLLTAAQERADAGIEEVAVAVRVVSSDYVAGEESALVHQLNGGGAKPTFIPPRPFEAGVGQRPTLLQNVETLAHLALIARFGAEWFREVGTPDDPGSVLITVSGGVTRSGVYEIAAGTRLGDLIKAAGGPIDPLQAFLIGGYAGTWFDVETALDVSLDHQTLRALGGTLGPGIVFALPQRRLRGRGDGRRRGVHGAGVVGPVRPLRPRPRGHRGRPARHRVGTRRAGHARVGGALERRRRRPRRLPSPRRRGSARVQLPRRLRCGDRPPRAAPAVCSTPGHAGPASNPGRPRARPGQLMSVRLRVNPIACEAHGMCAELLPEWIELDDWGYPIVASGPSPPSSSSTRGARPMPAPRWPCCSSARRPSVTPRRDRDAGGRRWRWQRSAASSPCS